MGKLADDWEEMFQRLRQFKKLHGHCNVSALWAEDMKLGCWVATQRAAYRSGRMSQKRIRRLEKTGFMWRVHNESWEKMFTQLVSYKETFGHCNVTVRWKQNRTLGLWVHRQRAHKKDNLLPQHRIQRLEEIGFQWKVKQP